MIEEETERLEKIDWIGFLKENWAWAAPLIYIYVTIVGMVQAWLQFRAFGINVFEFSEINDFLLAAFREPLSFLVILGLIVYGGIGIVLTKIMEKIRKAYFTLTESSFLGIEADGIPETLLNNLKSLQDQKISPENAFWKAIQDQIGEEQTAKYKEIILKHAIRKGRARISMSRMFKYQRWMMNILFVLFILVAPYYGPRLLHKGYGDEWKENFLSNPDRKVKATFKDMDKYGSKAGWVDNLILIGTTDKYVFFFDESKRDILIAPLSNVLLIRRAESSNKANAADAKKQRG